MLTDAELLALAISGAASLTSTLVTLLSVFVLIPWLTKLNHRRQFKVRIPGFSVRMNQTTPNISAANTALALRVFIAAYHNVVSTGPTRDVAKLVKGLIAIRWVEASNPNNGRWISDSVGRRVSGMVTANIITCVFLPEDTIDTTALFHELTHVCVPGSETYALDVPGQVSEFWEKVAHEAANLYRLKKGHV